VGGKIQASFSVSKTPKHFMYTYLQLSYN
jgi:hypothetical protein